MHQHSIHSKDGIWALCWKSTL